MTIHRNATIEQNNGYLGDEWNPNSSIYVIGQDAIYGDHNSSQIEAACRIIAGAAIELRNTYDGEPMIERTKKRYTPMTGQGEQVHLDSWNIPLLLDGETQRSQDQACCLLLLSENGINTAAIDGGFYQFLRSNGEILKIFHVRWIATAPREITNADGSLGYAYNGHAAGRLYNHLFELAESHGVNLITARINSGNPRSINFHLRHGFREVHDTSCDYGLNDFWKIYCARKIYPHVDANGIHYTTEMLSYVRPVSM